MLLEDLENAEYNEELADFYSKFHNEMRTEIKLKKI